MPIPRTPQELRAELLRLAELLLPGRGPVTVTATRGRTMIVRSDGPEEPQSLNGVFLSITPTQSDILGALSCVPRAVPQLAALCGRRPNKYFREQLKLLTDAGLAQRTSVGYRRVEAH